MSLVKYQLLFISPSSGSLEVTLAKKAEGLHWKYLLKDKSLGGEMASVTFTGGMAEMSEEEKTRLKQLLKGLDEKDVSQNTDKSSMHVALY